VSLHELLTDLRSRGITLSVDGDRLRCDAPKGSLSEELRQQLVDRKLDMIRLLRQAEHSPQPVPKVERGPRLPLSFAQERMWFLYRFQPDSPVYNITAFARLNGHIDPSGLEAAIREVALRHECLRTTFTDHEGSPAQVILPDCSVALPVTDLSPSSEPERMEQLRDKIRAQAGQPFDLSVAPLFRTSLVRLAPDLHVFVLTIHHIVSDGWSIGIFLRELKALYSAISTGGSATLAAPPLQYADYASWQRDTLSDETLQDDIAYWRQKLDDQPGVLDLPTDFPRPTKQGSEGAVYRFAIPNAVSSGLRSLSQQEGSSLFMVLLAVFKVLLSRYTHQTDILVGTPVHTRVRPELEDLIGCFINTLVLRTHLSGGITARELLHQVRETLLEGQSHQAVPFEKLVEALHTERSTAHSPLFQVTFNLQNTPMSSEYETISVGSMFDLSLFMWENAGGIGGAFEYRTDLFRESTIARMAEHLTMLAEAIVENPDQPVAMLPLVSREERTELLDDCNRTEASYPSGKTIPDLFSSQARRTPEAPAVVVPRQGGRGAQQITYRELELRSECLAHRLRSMGVGSQSLVGVCLDRSIHMVTGLLAVLKAGGAYVPMDPHFPRARLNFMMEDARLALVLCEEGFRRTVPPNIMAISPDRTWEQAESSGEFPPADSAWPDDLAYVIYTSGSTGTPKGVQITHRCVVNFLESMRREPGLAAEDRLLSVTTLSFDIAGLEIFLPLLVGASVMLAARDVAGDGRALAQLLSSSKATVMQATPVTWRILFEAGWQGQPGLKILCGGEALPRELANRLLATGSEVWNLYGPTETTIWSTLYRVRPGDAAVPIGKPIANTQVYILDEHRQLVPKGVPGELCIGGDGLARGYLNRPELTDEKFIPHPYLVGARLYRTGDLARWSPEGDLLYLGRLDYQVKIRGLRIELEEIEHLLRSHSDVQDAVVTAYRDNSGEMSLAAYIVARNGVDTIPLNQELRSLLTGRLPDYMVPSSLTVLERLPLTANGKVNRKGLPAPLKETTETVVPRNFIETQLLTMWQQVLQMRGIGIRDNFFTLGGHSLLAAKLLTQMEKVFGPLSLAWLFEAPTVEQMAIRLAGAGIEREWRSLVAIQPNGSKPPLFVVPGGTGNPLSSANFALRLSPDRPVYGLQFVGLDGTCPPLRRVEDIAAHFISEMRTLQKDGPYYLAGQCLGGTIAFEMAQQLARQGHELGSVIMIDPFPPRVFRLALGQLLSRALPGLTRFRRMARTAGLEPSGKSERLADLRYRISALVRGLRGEMSPEFRREILEQTMWETNISAMTRYRPKPFNGKIVLVACDGGTLCKDDPRMDWMALARSDSEVRHLPVPHHGELELQHWVPILAAELGKILGDETLETSGLPQ
jgi:amino acid adenylation domain-containing protein